MSTAPTKFMEAHKGFVGIAAVSLDRSQFLRIEKLKGPTRVPAAAKHNKREGGKHWRGAERIDRSRSHLNYALAGPGSAAEVARLYGRLLTSADVGTIRKDAVRAIEVVVSLPAGVTIDLRAYFERALHFLAERFGGESNIISADVHLDENSPHMHVLIVPLFDGRLQGSDAIGGPAQLCQMLDLFHEEVSAEFGLQRFSTATGRRRTRAERIATAAALVQPHTQPNRTLCSVGGAHTPPADVQLQAAGGVR